MLMAMATPKPIDKANRLSRGPMTIASLTLRLTKPILGKRGFVGADILAHWSVIVGPELARFAVPMEVRYPRGRNAGATLVLKVANGSAATLLQMKAPAVIERVNRFFGYAAIAQIQSIQGPLPAVAAPIPEPVTEERPATLADALAKLGKAVQHKTTYSVTPKVQSGDSR